MKYDLAKTACLCLLFSPVSAHAGSDGQGDHAEGPESVVVTHFTSQSELFLEYPALVAGHTSRFLAHLTDLSDFSPVQSGSLLVTLSQNNTVKAGFRVREPARAGLFTPEVTPRKAGTYELILTLESDSLNVAHLLGQVRVYASGDHVPVISSSDDGEVSYLKEQQWQGDFALTEVQLQTVQVSVPAPATLVAPADRFAVMRAPDEGILTAPELGFPAIGSHVSRGQLVATLRPRLATGTDTATLKLSVARARADERLAQQNLERLQDLFKAGAVAEHRLNEARNVLRVANAERTAAQARLQQLYNVNADSGVALLAPIDGRVVDLNLVPGAFVGANEVIMQIASEGPMWLRAEVAEIDATQIDQPAGAWFMLGEHSVTLRDGENARLVGVSGIINSQTRTLPVVFEFIPQSQGLRLRLNQRVATQVLTGEKIQALAVPRSAVIDDGGQPVVYVQTGGESFTRRAVRTGATDQNWVVVLSGVRAGERVVSLGAYDVHLSAAKPAEAGHGHAH